MPFTTVTREGLAYSPLVRDPTFGQLRPVFDRVGEAIMWSINKNQFITPHPYEDALQGIGPALPPQALPSDPDIHTPRRPVLHLKKSAPEPV